MRRTPSRGERTVWNIVRDRRLSGAKFRRQHPLEGHVADFACVEARLIIEVDGLSHERQRAYDDARTAKLAAFGWRVMRLRDRDVIADPGGIERDILTALNTAPLPPSESGIRNIALPRRLN